MDRKACGRDQGPSHRTGTPEPSGRGCLPAQPLNSLRTSGAWWPPWPELWAAQVQQRVKDRPRSPYLPAVPCPLSTFPRGSHAADVARERA